MLDASGVASSTAFDFLGDGTAEAMYADENQLFAFDSNGNPVMNGGPRQPHTDRVSSGD